jgi:hypothetical protein
MGNRVAQWIAALLLLLIASAVAAAGRALERRGFVWTAIAPAILTTVMAVVSLATAMPPYRLDHVKPVLAAIARDAHPDDRLFVLPGAWHAYRYYGSLSGITPDRVQIGRCARRSFRESLVQLDALRGHARVWVLFAHVVGGEGRKLLLSYLDRIGTRQRSVSVPDPYVAHSASVDAHLYDLSDPDRLRSASATTYPIQVDMPNEQTRCMGGLVPMEP